MLELFWYSPDGLAQAFILAEDFLDGAPSAMVLEDNIFFSHGLPKILAAADAQKNGATIFGYLVSDPKCYGVVDFDADATVKTIIEKPTDTFIKLVCRHIKWDIGLI